MLYGLFFMFKDGSVFCIIFFFSCDIINKDRVRELVAIFSRRWGSD